MPAWQIADDVRAGRRSAQEVLDHFVERIEARNAELNAFYHTDFEAARAAAGEVDERVATGGSVGAWAGVPIGVKELEDVAGWPSEGGSVAFQGRLAEEDSTQAARLRAAGAVFLGKTTSPEVGFVAFTNSKLHGVTRNPWDTRRTPGGSSGGTASAVAAGMVPIATASDGGGSIRIPASFCGLVGLKPTFGRIPTGPGVPEVTNTTVLGCEAGSVRDVARWLDVCAGRDDTDPLSLPTVDFSFEDRLGNADLTGLKVAWSPDLGYATVDPDVAGATEEAFRRLADRARLEVVERPVIIEDPGLAWAVLGSIDTMRDFGYLLPDGLDCLTDEVRMSVEFAASASLADIGPSLEIRHRAVRALAGVFADVDVLVTPTTPNTAFAAEGPMPTEIAGREVPPWATAAFTIPCNMAGIPAVSVPAGVDGEGLPIGMQIAGPRCSEHLLLELAAVAEREGFPSLPLGV